MIRIEVDDRAVRQALEQLASRVTNMQPAMHDIGQALVEGIRQRISEGRDWDGRAFAPNSPATIARKGRNQPLVDRGNFVNNRLHYAAGRDYVEVGSSAVQAATLHFGARRGQFGRTKRGARLPWGDIPPRPFLPVRRDGSLPDTARRAIIEAITDYLDSGA